MTFPNPIPPNQPLQFSLENKETLNFEEMKPDHPKWEVFIAMIVDYIVENWPEVLEKKTIDEFKREYHQELIDRIQEGGRALFLACADNFDIGIINAYFTKENDEVVINVAEFGVKKKARRRGYGSLMKKLLEQWGKSNGATKISIEVDKDQILANNFWSNFKDLSLDSSGNRNLYYRKL